MAEGSEENRPVEVSTALWGCTGTGINKDKHNDRIIIIIIITRVVLIQLFYSPY